MITKFTPQIIKSTPAKHHVSWVALVLATLSYQPAFAQEAVIIADGETVTETVRLNEDGDSLLIEEGGTIAVAGDPDKGVVANGDNITIIVDGTIETNTSDGDGIEVFGDNATVTNNGLIDLDGFVATGIITEGADATVTNNGTIIAQFDGIRSTGSNIAVVNNGLIRSTDFLSDGIDVRGANASVTNGIDGVIVTEDSSSQGLEATGDFASAVNHGTVVTEDRDSEAILIDGFQAEAHNTGRITTQGSSSEGILVRGEQSSATNSGSVMTTGTSAHAVRLGGNDVQFTNTGLLSATGETAFAISGSGDDQSVTLGVGSQIIGDVDLGGGDDTLIIEAGNASTVMTVLGVETIETGGDVAVLRIPVDATVSADGVVHTIDVTGPAVINEISDAIASDAHLALQAHVGTDGAWASLFGAARSRDDDGSTMAYDHTFAGLMAGYETMLAGNRAGFIGGVATTQVTTDVASTDVESESIFGGVYLGTTLEGLDLTASLLAGRDSHETERQLFDSSTGAETASASFDSNFVSAGLTVAGGNVELAGLQVRPSAMASYTYAAIDGYTETGTTQSNLTFDDRTTQTLSARAQLETIAAFGATQVAFRTGIDGRFSNEDDIGISIGADSTSFAATDSTSVLGGFVGARATFAQTDLFSLDGDVELGFADGQESTVAAGLNVSFSF